MYDYNKFLHNNNFIKSNKDKIKNIYMFKIDKGIILTNIHLIYCDDVYEKVNDLSELSYISNLLSNVVIDSISRNILVYGLTYNNVIYNNVIFTLEHYINKLSINSLIDYDMLNNDVGTFNKVIEEVITLFKNNIENVIGEDVDITDAFTLINEEYLFSNYAFVKCDCNNNITIVELK